MQDTSSHKGRLQLQLQGPFSEEKQLVSLVDEAEKGAKSWNGSQPSIRHSILEYLLACRETQRLHRPLGLLGVTRQAVSGSASTMLFSVTENLVSKGSHTGEVSPSWFRNLRPSDKLPLRAPVSPNA